MKDFLGKKKRALLALALAAGALGAAFPAQASAAQLQVERVEVTGAKTMTKEQIFRLLPSLKEGEVGATAWTVDPQRLSREIELVNDAGALTMKADFQKTDAGFYDVTLSVEEKKADSISVNVNNTGNDYTGDWRLGVNYVNRNLTGVSDTLGVAAVTSPGHWEDVKQGALVYRAILPRAGDSLYLSVSHSDVDLGSLGTVGGIGITATGRGTAAGAHYQHNFAYSRAKKQMIDFGVDTKDYDNATNFTYGGTSLLKTGADFTVTTASVSWVDTRRTANQAFAYSLGYTGNMSDGAGFTDNRKGADTHFKLFTASANWQYRTKGDWLVGVRANGQYTNDNIVSTEQIGAGGMYSVRGFKERAASADKGLVGSLELYSPEFAKNQRFLLFFDAARLLNNDPNVGELRSDNIASWGVGYRLFSNKSGLSARLDYADVIEDLDGSNHNVKRPWHLSVTQTF